MIASSPATSCAPDAAHPLLPHLRQSGVRHRFTASRTGRMCTLHFHLAVSGRPCPALARYEPLARRLELTVSLPPVARRSQRFDPSQVLNQLNLTQKWGWFSVRAPLGSESRLIYRQVSLVTDARWTATDGQRSIATALNALACVQIQPRLQPASAGASQAKRRRSPSANPAPKD